MKKSIEKRMWSHILKFSKVYFLHISVSIIATITVTFSSIGISDLLKTIVDMAMSKEFGNVYRDIILGITVLIIGAAAKYFFRYSAGKYGNSVMKDIRNATVEYIYKLPPDYTMRHKIGEILAKLSGDAGIVQNFLSNEFINLIYLPIMLIAFGAYLIYLNWLLFIISFSALPILIPATIKLVSPVKKNQREYMKYLAKANNNVQSSIEGIAVIKAYNLEEEMCKRYNESIRIANNIAFRNDKREYLINPINSIIATLPGIIAIVAGGYMTLKGKMTIGELIAFLNIFAMFTEPMSNLYLIIINSKVAMASAERLFSILEEPEEKSGNYIITKKDYDRSDITVELVNTVFSYDDRNSVLNGLSLTVSKGKSLALVGASGSGKSTILGLICRSYEGQGGCIKICGKNIEDIEVNSLRENLSYVSQSSFLFPFSIKDNILIGNPKATTEEVIEAAKKANAHSFIAELPDGYDTLVGERGMKLSGGQIQRIAIARAILKDAPILLLDEATSALDSQSEALVKEALDNLKKDKTLIVVAHRLSTIEGADEIAVVENGVIIERGNHSELIAKEKVYARLHLLAQGEVATA